MNMPKSSTLSERENDDELNSPLYVTNIIDQYSTALLECAESANVLLSNSFSVLRPSGNDTALVDGIVEDIEERKRINDSIMRAYPNVEQVGFISSKNGKNELQMAGGEFCGNATRSAVANFLNGKSGEITINVSGANAPLKAGINEMGDVWTEMPVNPSFEAIREGKNKFETLVTMEGISHIIQYVEEKMPEKEELKQKAMDLIKSYGLEKLPAAGVMFTQQINDVIKIDPVVYVKSIDTLIYESACGSGSTAVAIAECKKRNKSLSNFKIMQPSGMPISVSVDIKENMINKAVISGPVEKLQKVYMCNKLNENLDFNVEIANSTDSLESAFNNGLIELYQSVFAEPPYFESFSTEQVREYFEEYFKKGSVLLLKKDFAVMGFAATLPIKDVPDVETIMSDTLSDPNAWYIAEVGINRSIRKKGLARFLTIAEMENLPEIKTFIMRTSDKNIASQSLHKSIGFNVIEGKTQKVSQERLGENMPETDQRIFMQFKR